MDLLSLEKNGKAVYANYHSKDGDNRGELRTMSVAELYQAASRMVDFCTQNGQNTTHTPVFIDYDYKRHTFTGYSLGLGESGTLVCTLQTSPREELRYIAPDSRPESGEYWRSRGIGGGECSGFVVSKAAGERLRRMVNLVLENDTPKSHLDYRESEPNWIQFKFNENEFNLSNLDVMALENGNIITLDMLYSCKIVNDVKDIL